MRTQAMIGFVPINYELLHFSDDASIFFDLSKTPETLVVDQKIDHIADTVVNNQITIADNSTVLGAGITGAAAGVTGAVLNMQAEKTQKKAANFHDLLSQANPELNFRRDFMDGLISSLEEKGLDVVVLNDQNGNVPYFRWKAPKSDGTSYQQVSQKSLETVGADLLLQVSPIAAYQAGSVLNAYARIATVGVALYNGRTKEFYGYQEFSSVDGVFTSYHQYDSLVEDIKISGPELYNALMALIPSITSTVTRE